MPNILFSDHHLLIVDKPAGMLTQKDGSSSLSLEEWTLNWLKKNQSKLFLQTIHRLDKPVSGIVLFARSSKALSRLNQSMRERKMEKTYLALVEGILTKSQGILEHYLVHGDHQALIASKDYPEAKLARLIYTVIKTGNSKSLLKIQLETGRYHQIRAQLAIHGHPIVGDKKYGSRFTFSQQGIALHHGLLKFSHPTTQEMLSFESPPRFELQ